MKKLIQKVLFRRPSLRKPLNWLRGYKNPQNYDEWIALGRPCPPPSFVKHVILKEYATLWNLKIFIETGTFRGDTINALKDHFDEIISIELNEPLFLNTAQRFKDV
jgi:hypothetical protein